jgi:lysozyme
MPSRVTKGAAVAAIAISLISTEEGLRNYAYRDPVGIPTICFGETRNVHMGDFKTTDQCRAMLGVRLGDYSSGMDRCLKVATSDKTYAALLSFTYNVGVGAFCGSTLLKRANAGDLRGACDGLLAWNKARVAGVLVPLPGLTRRRQDERALCLEGLSNG